MFGGDIVGLYDQHKIRYIETSYKSVDMFNYYLNKIEDEELRNNLFSFFNLDEIKSFFYKPAAKNHHHNYRYGLLEHTNQVITIAIELGAKLIDLDRSILITSAILHDIGKILFYDIVNGNPVYLRDKDEHIKEGINIIKDWLIMKQYYKDIVISVIESHHGLIDWGAIHEPKNNLEWTIHLADMYSAKINWSI